jgi:DUF4097 and DUF4098 domain-containing protein YvlB
MAMTGAAGCSGFLDRSVERRTETESVRAADLSTLVVDGATDDVTLERRDTDEVRVRADKRASGVADLADATVTTRLQDERLTVSTFTPTVVGVGGVSVDLRITLPSTVAVDRVETDDGDVAVRGVAGDVRLRTHGGSVTARDLAGDLVAVTDDGAVTVDGTAGHVTAQSRDGDLAVESPGRVNRLETDDGDILTDVPRVTTSATVRTDDGDIAARLGPSLDAELRVQSRDGDVSVASDIETFRQTDGSVHGRVGTGDGTLRLRTADGDITLREPTRQ